MLCVVSETPLEVWHLIKQLLFQHSVVGIWDGVCSGQDPHVLLFRFAKPYIVACINQGIFCIICVQHIIISAFLCVQSFFGFKWIEGNIGFAFASVFEAGQAGHFKVTEEVIPEESTVPYPDGVVTFDVVSGLTACWEPFKWSFCISSNFVPGSSVVVWLEIGNGCDCTAFFKEGGVSISTSKGPCWEWHKRQKFHSKIVLF